MQTLTPHITREILHALKIAADKGCSRVTHLLSIPLNRKPKQPSKLSTEQNYLTRQSLWILHLLGRLQEISPREAEEAGAVEGGEAGAEAGVAAEVARERARRAQTETLSEPEFSCVRIQVQKTACSCSMWRP
jgi:hypothetical protein